MANYLLSGTSFYRKDVEQKIESYNKFVRVSNIDNQAKRLLDLKSSLEEREKKMLNKIFGANATKEGLKQSFYEAQKKSVLNKLSGRELGATIREYERAMTNQNALSQDELDKFLHSEEFLSKQEALGSFEKAILYFANQNIDWTSGHTGQIRSHPKLRKKEINIETLLVDDLAPVTQSRYFDFLSKKSNKKLNRGKVNKTFTARNNQITIQVPFKNKYIDWYALTEGKKASQVSSEEKAEAAKTFKKALKFYLGPEYKKIPNFNLILNYMLKGEKASSLFIGRNEKAITGFLGEFQALCYLSILLGDNFSIGNNKIVNWVATNKNSSGKQYHADIVLEDFGIQVKNSTKDIVDTINFYEGSLQHFLNILPSKIFSQEEKDLISSLYSTYYFNIPFEYIGTYAEERYNDVYQPTYNELVNLIHIADKMLTFLMDQFMFIGTGNAKTDQLGNIVFFIGGKDLLFASDIIGSFIDKINQQINDIFSIKRPATTYNIVNFINENQQNIRAPKNSKGYLDRDQSISLKSSANRVGGFVQEEVLSQIKLQTSFNFSSLLKQF